jgi:hypothetical protein
MPQNTVRVFAVVPTIAGLLIGAVLCGIEYSPGALARDRAQRGVPSGPAGIGNSSVLRQDWRRYPGLAQVAKTGHQLLVVAKDVEAEALATLIVNQLRGALKSCAVKAPGFGDRRKAMLQDIGVLTGGQVISEELGFKLENATLEQLGRAKRVVVDKDNTTIIGGAGDRKLIDARIEQIRREIDKTTSNYDREVAGTAGKIIWRCGGDPCRRTLGSRDEIEERGAGRRDQRAEGIVPGGGLVLLPLCCRRDAGRRHDSMSDKNIERLVQRPENKCAITRDRYDAVLLDLDGVITDTASLHAACWKQVNTCRRVRGREAKHFAPSILPLTIGSMWMASPATTAFATFSHRAASGFPREALMTRRRPKKWTASETARTTWSTHRRKRSQALPGQRRTHLSAPPLRIQNRRRHLEPELHGCLKGGQVSFLRRTSRWQCYPCRTPGRQTSPGYLLDGGKTARG